jgi:hypothetical protein
MAACLVGGTWWASHPAIRHKAPLFIPPTPKIEADAMVIRTGDRFWGLHLDGVLPCSTILVKGGGNLVTLSAPDDHGAHCIYQVVKEKQIVLRGQKFRLRVIAPDQCQVERDALSTAVAVGR